MTALPRDLASSAAGFPVGEGLRKAREDDLARVLEIERSSFPSPWPRSAFQMALSAPDLLFLVAEVETEVAGYVVAARGGGTVLIANIAVDAEQRGLGRGKDLLENTLTWARVSGATRCRLEVRISNHGAIELYRQRGFRPVAVQPGYYSSPPEDALTMLLLLEEKAPS